MKKKILLLVFALASTLTLVSCGFKKDMVLFIPNDYIDKSVIKAFEKEKGVKVGVVNFNSNEIALGQIKSNSYDLAIPSDYATEELASEGYLDKLDWDKITFSNEEFNTKLATFMEELKLEGFDFLEYSMPYYWGTIGMIYNNSIAGLEDRIKTEGWNILEDKTLKKMLYDSSRDSFMVGLASQGIKLSEANTTNVKAAQQWLIDVKKNNGHIQSDEILGDAIGGKTPYDVAVVYSGDAVYIMQETPKYSFYVPELSNVWIDGFVIPKNAKNKDLAYEFINWFSAYDNNITNTEEIGYTSIRQDVTDDLLKTPEFSDPRVKVAFNVEGVLGYEFFRFNKDIKRMIDEAWTSVKAN